MAAMRIRDKGFTPPRPGVTSGEDFDELDSVEKSVNTSSLRLLRYMFMDHEGNFLHLLA